MSGSSTTSTNALTSLASASTTVSNTATETLQAWSVTASNAVGPLTITTVGSTGTATGTMSGWVPTGTTVTLPFVGGGSYGGAGGFGAIPSYGPFPGQTQDPELGKLVKELMDCKDFLLKIINDLDEELQVKYITLLPELYKFILNPSKRVEDVYKVLQKL